MSLSRSLLALVVVLWASSVSAATYYANPTTGNDGRTCAAVQNSSTPKLTLQSAYGCASPGDTVIAQDGTYNSENSTCGLTAILCLNNSGSSGNWITIRAANRHGAVLNGNSYTTDIAIIANSGSASYIEIDGFEIEEFEGGGISFDNAGSFFSVVNNWIHHIGNVCDTSVFGLNAIYNERDNVTISGNLFHNIGRLWNGESGCSGLTTSQLDHGIYANDGDDLVITNNIFRNFNRGWSIQIYPNASDDCIIRNNTFAHPSATGNIVSHIILATTITDCDISNNISYDPSDAFVYSFGALFGSSSNITLRNNIVYGADVWYGGSTPSGVTITGTITSNPLFTDAGGNDFTLQAGSPARNAGLSFLDIPEDYAGTGRPQGSGWEIGAYEYDETPCETESTLPHTFTGTNGTTIAANNCNWVTVLGGFQIQSNAFQPTGATENLSRWTVPITSPNQYGQIRIAAVVDNTWVGSCVRMQAGTSSGYCVFVDLSTETTMVRVDSGSIFTLSTDVTPPVAVVNDTVRMEATGTSITFKRNGATEMNAVDATYSSGYAGLLGYATGAMRGDDFTMGSLGVSRKTRLLLGVGK